MSAALTPRVRILAVCDEAHTSRFEIGVCSLEGVRFELRAPTFPFRRSLSVYMLLSSPREGVFPCKVKVIDVAETLLVSEKPIRVAFDEENEPVPLVVDCPECAFPAPGIYVVQVLFTGQDGVEVLKGEQTLRLRQQVE